ncbi:MAG: SBBP repeat-containing protein, partial [Bacteroidetes bacterium]|nr:SBBP repeat-containing protein [Bacteroidota bacterium]
AKISKTGSMTNWGTYLGGSGTEDNMMGLNTDLNDDIYVLGYSNSTNYPVTANPIQSTNFGINDAVFTKLSSNGVTKIYSTYYGGRADDDDPLGQRGILFSACRIYLSVTASSTNIPLTQGAVNTGKTSISGILEPVIVSLANPPDVSNATISSSQTLSCGQTPTTLTAGAAAYNIATVLRSDTVQSTGTAGNLPVQRVLIRQECQHPRDTNGSKVLTIRTLGPILHWLLVKTTAPLRWCKPPITDASLAATIAPMPISMYASLSRVAQRQPRV